MYTFFENPLSSFLDFWAADNLDNVFLYIIHHILACFVRFILTDSQVIF